VVTTGVFETANPVFRSLINRYESDRCHQLLVVIDLGVHDTHPGLSQTIANYASAHGDAPGRSVQVRFRYHLG